MNEEAISLEGQLRECYGRVVYSHKTQEKCADIMLTRHKRIKLLQIVLAALVAGGLITTVFDIPGLKGHESLGRLIGIVLSTGLLALNSYAKDYDLGEIAQKHRHSAADMWLVREKYLTLLTDLRASDGSLDKIRHERDRLLELLHTTYKGAPSTDSKAYKLAQKALKTAEDLTFSDSEIDAFLPKELRRSQ